MNAVKFVFAHRSERTIRDNVDRITESVKSRTKVFVSVAEQPQFYRNELYHKLWLGVSHIFIALGVN
jgi:peptide methionine sulfoxide reductase MsrA